MELDNRDEELDIERVSEHYYSSGLYYNSSSQVNLNFKLEQVEKENMSGTFTLPKDLTNALYGSVLEKRRLVFNQSPDTVLIENLCP